MLNVSLHFKGNLAINAGRSLNGFLIAFVMFTISLFLLFFEFPFSEVASEFLVMAGMFMLLLAAGSIFLMTRDK